LFYKASSCYIIFNTDGKSYQKCKSQITVTSLRAGCKSKTGRHNQDGSRRATNHRCTLTRPVLKTLNCGDRCWICNMA